MDFDREEGLSDDDFYEYVNEYFHNEFSTADKAKLAYKTIKETNQS